MAINEEKVLFSHPNPFSLRCTEKILEQMKKNICKIYIGDNKGTGFFTQIPFPDKENKIPVLITNNHIINKGLFNSEIEISIYDISGRIKLDLSLSKRMKYTGEEYDITIIQILEKDKINNFLELDDKMLDNIIYNKDNNNDYEDKTIYIIQYPQEGLSVSYGILKNIYLDKTYKFIHTCSTNKGSSGSPIIGMNNKIIGIHSGAESKNSNYGSFLNLAIRKFIETKNEMLLLKFNQKYKTADSTEDNSQIEVDTEEIVMIEPEIPLEDKGLSELTEISLDNLKLLNLSGNKITNINCLKNSKFKSLEKLVLKKNNINNIFVLTTVKFNKLKELELSKNKIKDITPLKNAIFDELEKLLLDNNGIEDINVLKEVNFRELKELNFCHNNIGDIDSLGANSIKFGELKKLILGNNKIKNIKALENAKFKENLIELNLKNNVIKDISALANFKTLKILKLGKNKISDIDKLSELKDNLEELYLGNNMNLKNIEIFSNIKFEKLKKLTLGNIGKPMNKNACYAIKKNQPENLILQPSFGQSNTQGS